jgi:hypothetical protein
MNLNKNFYLILKIVLIAIASILIIRIMITPDDQIMADVDVQDSLLNPALNYTYFLSFVAVIGVFGFSIYQIISNPKQGLKTIIGIVALLVIWFISRAFATDEVTYNYMAAGLMDDEAGHKASLLSGAGLIMTFILLIATLVAIVYVEVAKIFK